MNIDRAREVLKQYWGFPDFRPGQDDVVQSVLEGKDTVVLFPTGGGKSLCYQVPALVMEGVTIVISPLVALMQDQVEALKDKGIAATFINSTISRYETEQRLVNARNGMYKLLYCSPERLSTPLWQAEADKLPISMIAIDEAHCISEWGHDFRPQYREIRENLEGLPQPFRWMALTATATPEVRDDIIQNLEFDDPNVISKGFERPNLKYWVIHSEQKKKKIFQVLKKGYGTGLIYGGTRRMCEELAGDLQHAGISAHAYHAGMEAEEREKIQKAWIEDEIRVVVATSAFGMGIDKSDCRYVIHYQMPYSLEAYYQEAGRAGRDGEVSYPILLYRPGDYFTAKKRLEQSYPDRAQLEQVYHAVCDALQLARGSQQVEPRAIAVDELVLRSNTNEKTVFSSLRILDQLGIIKEHQSYVQQLRLRFNVSREFLVSYVNSLENKKKSRFVDQLHRMGSPHVFSEFEAFDMHKLEENLAMPSAKIIKGLNVLKQEQLLNYELTGENPILFVTEPRYSRLPLDNKQLERHRDILLSKLDYMKGYAEARGCRSKYIRVYFGEVDVPDYCGFCDWCLRDEKENQEHLFVHQKDVERLKELLEKPKLWQELREKTAWTSARLKSVINYLEAENKLGTEIKNGQEYYFWLG